MNMNCMQSVGKAFWATVLSVLRQGVLLIPLLFLLNALGGLTGVIYGAGTDGLYCSHFIGFDVEKMHCAVAVES